ncbi:hypothetical protein MOQ_005291, partial [Trypanosoma cruzi marinkellei]
MFVKATTPAPASSTATVPSVGIQERGHMTFGTALATERLHHRAVPITWTRQKSQGRHPYGGVATAIRSARPRNWWWWCHKRGVESAPVASSPRVVLRSRESALHNKQRHHTRTAYTARKRKSTAAVLRHGGQGSTSIARSNWLTEVRMVVAPLPRGACGLWLPWTERMVRGKRDAVRSASISVDCGTSDATSSD